MLDSRWAWRIHDSVDPAPGVATVVGATLARMTNAVELHLPTGSAGRVQHPSFEAVHATVASFLKERADDGGAYAGAVLLVAKGAEVLSFAAFGYAELFDSSGRRLPTPRPMRREMLFDLASITKVLGTTTALARLYEENALSVASPLGRFLPSFMRPDKRDITVADALSHSSGLASWMPFYLFVDEPNDALEMIADLPITFPRGHRRVYSDVNFVVLGRIVEAVSGLPLDRAIEELVTGPLGLDTVQFLPPVGRRADIVATSLGNPFESEMCATRTFPRTPPVRPGDLPGWRHEVVVGDANDANCHLVFRGVSGHAGLFGSAEDLARFGRAMIEPLGTGRESFLTRDTLEFFTTPKSTPGQALGWWCRRINTYPRTFGHRGFVGSQLFLDPENDVVVVLLTNRVHRTLPYAEANTYTEPIVRSVYEALGLGSEARVDAWEGPGFEGSP